MKHGFFQILRITKNLSANKITAKAKPFYSVERSIIIEKTYFSHIERSWISMRVI